MAKIIGIMACTKEGVIGCNQAMPWHYPDEIAFFKNTTRHSTLIMGRKTYEATPKSLFQERTAVVLSRNPAFIPQDTVVFHTIEACMRHLHHARLKRVFMIGGGEIASLFLQGGFISSFFLTEISKPYPGDAYLNLSYFADWKRKKIQSTPDYTIYFLKKF